MLLTFAQPHVRIQPGATGEVSLGPGGGSQKGSAAANPSKEGAMPTITEQEEEEPTPKEPADAPAEPQGGIHTVQLGDQEGEGKCTVQLSS